MRPRQRITKAEKNEAYWKQTADYYRGSCMNAVQNYQEYYLNYALLEGYLEENEYLTTTNYYGVIIS